MFQRVGTLCGSLINGYCASDKKSRKSFLAERMPFRWEQNRGGRRVMAVWHFPNYLQNLSLERGLACIVQSWFFCFLLALPSPFQSCADVKGYEVTARGRYWVGAGREAGRRARPGSPCAEFLLPPCCWCCRGFVGDTSLNYR